MTNIHIEHLTINIQSAGAELIQTTLDDIVQEVTKQTKALVEQLTLQAPVASPEPITEQVDPNPKPSVKQVLQRLRLIDKLRWLGCSDEFIAQIQFK